MPAASAVSSKSFARRQFQAVFDGVICVKATLDPASLADGVGETDTVAVPGAKLGDFVLASLGVDAAGITVTAYVSATDVVSYRIQNESGGVLDLASNTIKVLVLRPSSQLFV